MFDANRLLLDLIGGGLSGGGIGRTVMSPQGLTILGGLAIAAYEHFKGTDTGGGAGTAGEPAGSAPSAQPYPPGTGEPGMPQAIGESGSSAPPVTPPPFVPPGAAGPATPDAAGGASAAAPIGEERARLLITAMVSAAKADGAIDPDERARILGQLAQRGSGDAERAYLEDEMARPLEFDRLVSQVRDPVLAAEVYTASLLAIDPDTPAEKAYLSTLAARLNLEPGVIKELETRLDASGD